MRIFLTGASGFVGGEVAARLVEAGHGVTALVRKSPTIRANGGRLVEAVVRLVGDVAEPFMGLDRDCFRRIASEHDLILHCAATTRFDLGDDEYAAINVGGAAHAVEFAQNGGLPLLHVSTAYVCGTRDGRIAEDDPLPEAGWANGYERSKAAAERIVASSGLHHAIVRPSIVVGDSRTGQVREFGAVYGLFKMMAEGRFRRIPAAPGASLDFVPIDYVGSGIVELAERIEEARGVYHLVSGAPISLDAAVRAVAGFDKLQAAQLVDPDLYDPALLTGRERWIFENAFRHYSSYTHRNPEFDDSRFRAFSCHPRPSTDIVYFHKLIQYAIDAGYVKVG